MLLSDGKADSNDFDGIREKGAYLIKTVKNSSAPPKTTRVIEKSGEILQRLLLQ